MNESVRELITKYLGDMHALESHGLEAVERQIENLSDADHPNALAAARQFKSTLESHIAAIDARLRALGGSPTGPLKEAAAAVAGVAAGLYNKVRSEEASKSLRDDYTFFSHAGIAYLMLYTTARAFGDDETAGLAERGYRDAADMAMRLDKLVPGLVLDELRQDKLSPRDVAADVGKMVHDAWTRQSTSGSSAR